MKVRLPQIPDMLNAAAVLVDANVEQGRGDKVAIYYGDEQITYAQVQERVNRTGNALKALGVEPENRVLILMLDCPEFVYAFFGAMKIGAVPVPVNTLMTPADYKYFLNDSRAKVAVVHAALAGQVAAVRGELDYLQHLIVTGAPGPGQLGFTDLVGRAAPDLQPFATSKDDMCFWLYSSGTTGFPKGTVHLHHDMIVAADLYARSILDISERDITFSVAKLFFAYGLGNALYFPFRVGAATVLMPDRPEPAKILATIDRFKPTLFFCVPTAYAAILAADDVEQRYDLSSIRLAVSAGEALPAVLYERWRERFGSEVLDGIGSTEMTHIFISNRPGEVRPGSTGKPVPGYAIKLVDDDGLPVPQGEVGNLLVAGDSAAAFYWNKHEKTKETFQGHWTRTGDKYYQDADGYLHYVGRSDDMLKAGGIWVSPVEVEACLMQHRAVLECGVVGETDDEGLDKPVAYVVLQAGYSASDELARAMQQHVKERLAPYKYPRRVEFIAELPKTATGKIQRYKLRQRAVND